MDTDEWALVGRAIRHRRGALRMSQSDLAQAAGVSLTTISLLETAGRERYLPAKMVAVESALGWEPGSLEMIGAGGSPIARSERSTAAGVTLRVTLPAAVTDDEMESLRQLVLNTVDAFILRSAR